MDGTQGVITVQWREGRGATLHLPAEASGLGARLPPLQGFAQRAVQWLQQLGLQQGQFALQLHDEAPWMPCFRFDAPLQPDGGGPLIPDPYALGTQGFAAVRDSFQRLPLPPWRERLGLAIWRGSSTGSPALHRGNLWKNRRYQLCQLSQRLPQLLDARFTAVVQSANPTARSGLISLLRQQGHLAPRLQPWQLALHRFLIEIDGNVNSWGLLWKLLSGCCILRVSSGRRQWYHHRLQAWVHVVPVAADLSDLPDKLAWCQAQPEACQAIASAGQRLGLQVVAELEQDQQRAVLEWAKPWMEAAPGRPPIG